VPGWRASGGVENGIAARIRPPGLPQRLRWPGHFLDGASDARGFAHEARHGAGDQQPQNDEASEKFHDSSFPSFAATITARTGIIVRRAPNLSGE
jgi:hypothetical protein